MTLLKVISRHLPTVTVERMKTFSHDNRSPGRDLNPGPSKYETGVPTARPDVWCI
jgi:hypothetical protein